MSGIATKPFNGGTLTKPVIVPSLKAINKIVENRTLYNPSGTSPSLTVDLTVALNAYINLDLVTTSCAITITPPEVSVGETVKGLITVEQNPTVAVNLTFNSSLAINWVGAQPTWVNLAIGSKTVLSYYIEGGEFYIGASNLLSLGITTGTAYDGGLGNALAVSHGLLSTTVSNLTTTVNGKITNGNQNFPLGTGIVSSLHTAGTNSKNNFVVQMGGTGTFASLTGIFSVGPDVCAYGYPSNSLVITSTSVAFSNSTFWLTGLGGGTAATGTGGLVRATSPTLVSPILGTPTSGDLTNCTGYSFGALTGIPGTFSPSSHGHAAGDITSGVIAAARLGTGASGTNFLRSDGTWQTVSGGGGSGDALVANPLSQFAATTSTQLAGVISDETGSGALVFGTDPTISGGIFTGTSVFRFASGAAGTDEIQISHNGTLGLIETKDGNLVLRSASNITSMQNAAATGTVTFSIAASGGGYLTCTAFGFDFVCPSNGFRANTINTASSINQFDSTTGIRLGSGMQVGWSSNAAQFNAVNDTALRRNAAGIIEINNGTAGQFRDLRLRNLINTLTTPASAAATGVAGTITADADHVYVCTAINTWKRVAIATW